MVTLEAQIPEYHAFFIGASSKEGIFATLETEILVSQAKQKCGGGSMPVPKGYEKKYGIIVASLQAKHGMSLEEAKAKADKAVKDLKAKKRK